MADDEHESLRRVHGYIATVSTVGQPRCDSLVGSLSFCEMAHETRRPNITNSCDIPSGDGTLFGEGGSPLGGHRFSTPPGLWMGGYHVLAPPRIMA